MRELAIHQITMMQGGPAGLVRFAAKAGLRRVCLFTATPLTEDGQDMFPIVRPDQAEDFRKLMDDHSVSVINAEYFPIMPGLSVGEYCPAIETAAKLAVKRLVTHIHETDPARILEELERLCGFAKQYEMEVGLEFTGFAKGCDNLEKAAAIHRELGQPNLKIAVDALHLFRTGGTLEQLAAIDPAIIGYAQICDGPHFRVYNDYVEEAMNRMIPGEGMFPLRELVALLGDHVDLDIEVPHFAETPGFDAERWAIEVIDKSYKLLI